MPVSFLRNSDIYVSPNLLWVCGHKADEVMDMGSDFYVKHIPPEELDSILGLAARLHKFLMCQSENERHLFSASYDVLIVNGKKSILLNHRVSPLDYDSVGTFGLLCVMCQHREISVLVISKYVVRGSRSIDDMTKSLTAGCRYGSIHRARL